jgi:hypothetical protein
VFFHAGLVASAIKTIFGIGSPTDCWGCSHEIYEHTNVIFSDMSSGIYKYDVVISFKARIN